MVQLLFPDIDVESRAISDTPGYQEILLEVRNSNGVVASSLVTKLGSLDRLVKGVPFRVTRKEDRTTYRFRFVLEVFEQRVGYGEFNPRLYVQRAVLAA